MKRFLVGLLIIAILQILSRLIVNLFGIQFDITVFITGAVSGLLYSAFDDLFFENR